MARGWKNFDPLITFTNPLEIWEVSPTNLIVEIQLIFLFVCCTIDAFFIKNCRFYVTLWYAAFLGGIFIEIGTIMNEEIANFYHSQFSIMVFNNFNVPFFLIYFVCFCFFPFFLIFLQTKLNTAKNTYKTKVVWKA